MRKNVKEQTIRIAPSLMCADMCNLERSVRDMEKLGIEMLHIDIIDGSFSPSMPLGIDTIKQLRKITNLDFDIHLMVQDNEFFIKEMIEIGVQQISFHHESSMHTDRLLNLIRNQGIKAGVALNPSTPLSVLEYSLDQCDNLLLMLINPGFAGHKGESQVPYAAKKVSDAYRLIREKDLDISLEIDGRVSLESIPSLVEAGADTLVAGSTSLFIPGNSIEENKMKMQDAIKNGLEGRLTV
jgi:ribulose-phosphate 3-epimerase